MADMSTISNEIRIHTPIIKRQRWNAAVMANIWKKHEQLDPGQCANIKALYDNAKANHCYNVSTYSYFYSKNSVIARAGYGRLYSNEKGSLERLEKTLRHSLCAGIYWDIDMVNAQPTILSQLAKKCGLTLVNLAHYAENRDAVIRKLMEEFNMTRDEVKEWILKCMFGCKIPELKSLQNELRTLANELRNSYGDLYERIVKSKEKNQTGTFLAYVAQTEECKCLLAMNDFLTKQGREVGVLCYDGCMVTILQNEKEFPSELLRSCEKYISDVTGYSLTLLVKEMKCAEEFTSSAKLLRISDIDDVYMTRKFIMHMNGCLINDTDYGIMVFQEDIGFWSHDTDILRRKIIEADLKEDTLDGLVNYSGYVFKQDIIIKQLPSLIPIIPFCERTIDKTIGKLLFKNGIYDIPTKTFTKGFDKSLYFSGRIDRDFPDRDESLITNINKLLFEDPFLQNEQDVGVYQKSLIARAIAGHYRDKVTIWAIGETNSGKGVQSIALLQCFESNVTIYNPNSLLYNKNSGTDEAKKLSWVYPIHNSRIAIGNEVRPGGIIDISIVKALVSGGDFLTIRKNFINEEKRINRSTLLYFCNDMAKFNASDSATIDRVKIYEYKLSFVNKPECKLESWERKAFPVKELFEQDCYKDAYFWCIMDAYTTSIPTPPQTSLASAKEWIPTPIVSFQSCLMEAGYQIVKGNDDIYIPFSELKSALLESGAARGMTDQAIGRELKKLGLESVEKRIDSKVTKCRKFITKVQK